MKAVVTTAFGPASQVLKYVEDLPVPTADLLKPTQILLKVCAAGVNPGDWRVRRGDISWIYPKHFPCVLGMDAAGQVVATGSAVKRLSVGDEVFGQDDSVGMGVKAPHGTFAQYAIVEEAGYVKKSAAMDWQQGAALPTCGLTVMEMLRTAGLSPQMPSTQAKVKSVLIYGASGGTGSLTVLLAKHMLKIERVYAVCSAKNRDDVKSLGADRVIDYLSEDLVQVVKNEEAEQRVELVLDCIGGSDVMSKCASILPAKAKLVTIALGNEPNIVKSMLSFMYSITKRLVAYWLGFGPKVHLINVAGGQNASDLETLATFFAEKKHLLELISLTPYDLVDLAKAHEASEGQHVRGKLVINIPE